MNAYRTEQHDSLAIVRTHLSRITLSERDHLRQTIAPHLDFRNETERFLSDHLSQVCTRSCYENRLSACCTKDGIVTFFADMVVNALVSTDRDLERMTARLRAGQDGYKCVYLDSGGCVWSLKPIVCEMFVCDKARKSAFSGIPELGAIWEGLEEKRKRFTWPDRPVLFDAIEDYFIQAGYRSSLMYFHNSPGLIRIKEASRKKGNYRHER